MKSASSVCVGAKACFSLYYIYYHFNCQSDSRETRIWHEQKECDTWLQQRDSGPAEPLVTGTHWEQWWLWHDVVNMHQLWYITQHCDITSRIPIHSTLRWHLLNSHGMLCVLAVCACAQREIIASLRGGKKLFNRGAHGGKAISNNVLFLQQQLCLTPMASAAHYLSSHLFLHRLPPCPDIHQQ